MHCREDQEMEKVGRTEVVAAWEPEAHQDLPRERGVKYGSFPLNPVDPKAERLSTLCLFVAFHHSKS